jgi:hypothetical protein
MTAHRFSRLQKRLLTWLAAAHQRTGGVTARSHQELVRALAGDKGNMSHRLRTQEARGLWSLAAPPVAKPNTSGSRWKVKNGRGNSQEVVNKTKVILKQ